MAVEIERRPIMVERTEVRRYGASARVNHWITAATFTLLALSGLALFHPSLFFLTDLFGGGANTRAFHPWLGVVLIASFAILFVRFWSHNLWNRDDTQWTKQIGDVVKGEEEKLPELGKYNAGQKMVFWGTALLIVVLFATGLVIWDEYFHGLVSIGTNRLAALVHSLAAIAAILLIIVHVYAGIWVKGSIRGMTEGRVTGGWAWRHHRKWLRQEAKGETHD
ncbi:formate dehydrogenase subunit gamma [Methylopila capsulata]|uniref:Formate dehydrogenase subunit gamma n=1 Tax=Methylopila capsulata TaxID=61654 RepID=A0A9W6ISK6_9HYPH|nr:formate dehydrogenase subunit gamma [Methylopila capsulata]MBM7850462.1 formate dehydrogenase subunit gamma [Methylopila capsulata]GLK55756.1 formate dehydrogenase subunit gamma [Methylopila capsulata]